MLKLYLKIILLLTLIGSLSLNAQNVNESENCACCTENHKAFDFWVGNWNVYNTENIIIGHNKIVKMQDNCVLQENWTSKNSTGTSYNYYNSADDSWNQVWIDNSGFSLVLKGNIEDTKMVLKSDIIKGDKTYYNKITWSKIDDVTVSQVWEIFDENNTLLKELFRGIYKKE